MYKFHCDKRAELASYLYQLFAIVRTSLVLPVANDTKMKSGTVWAYRRFYKKVGRELVNSVSNYYDSNATGYRPKPIRNSTQEGLSLTDGCLA